MSYDILLLSVHRDNFGSVPEDIGIGVNLLTLFLAQRGFQAAMFRGFAHQAEGWLEQQMREKGAASIGLYSDYENVTLVEQISRYVRDRWEIPVFVGGPQAVGLGRDFLEASRCDAIVRGEGEITLLELLDGYCRQGRNRSEIAGITWLDSDGRLVVCPDRDLIEDLDSLPWPDFRLEAGHERWNILPVITGRGCPFQCAFCYEGHNSRKVRFRSVSNVMEEIRCHFDRHPNLKYIFFVDDTFTLNPKRVGQFCDELSRLRKTRDFVWFCEGHIQTLHQWPEMLDRMAEAGLVKLFIGIESGSNRVLSLYRKQTRVEWIESVVRRCVEAGIPQITGNIIVGGPVESPETIDADIQLITRLLHAAPGRFDALGFFLMPYPNTAVRTRPADFGIRLLLERELHGMEDIPMTETDAFSWPDMFTARHTLNRRIQQTMIQMVEKREVPHDTIQEAYRLAYRYGVYSRWLINVYTRHPVLHTYHRLLAGGAVRRRENVPCEEMDTWHPQRVFEIWNTVSWENEIPRIGTEVLSPLEYELLLLCSGKLRLRDVLNEACTRFGDRYNTRGSFHDTALQLLAGMEDRGMLVWAPF